MKTEHKDESGNWEYGKNNQETHLIFLILEYVRKETLKYFNFESMDSSMYFLKNLLSFTIETLKWGFWISSNVYHVEFEYPMRAHIEPRNSTSISSWIEYFRYPTTQISPLRKFVLMLTLPYFFSKALLDFDSLDLISMELRYGKKFDYQISFIFINPKAAQYASVWSKFSFLRVLFLV